MFGYRKHKETNTKLMKEVISLQTELVLVQVLAGLSMKRQLCLTPTVHQSFTCTYKELNETAKKKKKRRRRGEEEKKKRGRGEGGADKLGEGSEVSSHWFLVEGPNIAQLM